MRAQQPIFLNFFFVGQRDAAGDPPANIYDLHESSRSRTIIGV